MASIYDTLIARRVYPPFGTAGVADANTLLDIGVTNGIGTPVAWSASPGNGFALGGTGGTFDAVRGFNTQGTAYLLSNSPGFSVSNPIPSGTIYLQVERAAISADNSQNITSTTSFSDSVGEQTGGTCPYLLGSGAGNQIYWFTNVDGGSFPSATIALRLTGNFATGTALAADTLVSHPNSNVPSSYDQTYAETIFTWSGRHAYFYIDGQLVWQNIWAAPPTSALFNQIYIGTCNPGFLQFPSGRYIKRIQISKNFCQPKTSGPMIAMMGDSFTRRADNSNSPASATVANINAAQMYSPAGSIQTAADAYGVASSIFGQAGWYNQLLGLMHKNLGFYCPWYNAGESGKGWARNTTGGASSGEFTQAYGDAIIQASPEILIGFCSVNDCGIAEGAPNSYGADIKAKLDYITAGKSGGTAWANGVTQYPRRLRAIIFYEGFSWYASFVSTIGGVNQSTYLSRWNNNRASAKISLQNATSNGVPVIWADTDAAWTGASNYRDFLVNSSSRNVITSGANRNAASGGTDGHPAAVGMTKMADLMWPALLDALTYRPVRS